jgi:hypothetical protein
MTQYDDHGGMTKRAAQALGFLEMCKCGHEEGLHNEHGECVLIDCSCMKFRLIDGEEK